MKKKPLCVYAQLVLKDKFEKRCLSVQILEYTNVRGYVGRFRVQETSRTAVKTQALVSSSQLRRLAHST